MAWTQERRQQAIKLWGEGKSFLTIARELGGFEGYREEGRCAVSGLLKRAATPARPPKRKPAFSGRRPNPKHVLAAAIVLNAFDEAMEETGLSLMQVCAAVRLARQRDRYERVQMQAREAADAR